MLYVTEVIRMDYSYTITHSYRHFYDTITTAFHSVMDIISIDYDFSDGSVMIYFSNGFIF